MFPPENKEYRIIIQWLNLVILSFLSFFLPYINNQKKSSLLCATYVWEKPVIIQLVSHGIVDHVFCKKNTQNFEICLTNLTKTPLNFSPHPAYLHLRLASWAKSFIFSSVKLEASKRSTSHCCKNPLDPLYMLSIFVNGINTPNFAIYLPDVT